MIRSFADAVKVLQQEGVKKLEIVPMAAMYQVTAYHWDRETCDKPLWAMGITLDRAMGNIFQDLRRRRKAGTWPE